MSVEAAESLFAGCSSDLRVTIVDNDSQDGSYDEIANLLRAKNLAERVDLVASDRNGGLGYGINLAVEKSWSSPDPADYFLFLNSDAFPEPGAVEKLLNVFKQRPDAGIVGCHMHDGETHPSVFRFPSLLSELEGSLRLGIVSRLLRKRTVCFPLPESTSPVDWVSGSCFMCRSQVLRDIGLFDEHFFLYFEETDLCKRARKADWFTYCEPTSRVRHLSGASTGEEHDLRVPECWFDSRKHYFRKHHGRVYLWIANVIWFSGYCIWRLRRRIQRKPDNDPPRLLGDFARANFGIWNVLGPRNRI